MLLLSRRLVLRQSPIYYFSVSTVAAAAMSTSANSPSSGTAAAAASASCTNLLAEYPIGLGTFDIPRNYMSRVIRQALQVGYRRIDCAPVYFNEDAVGDALHEVLQEQEDQQLDIKRSDLYLVSKLASPFHRREHVELACRKTLNDLRTDYLDLYLIHWPVAFQYVPIDPTVRGFENEEIDESENGRRIDPTVSLHETWQAMQALVDKGLVREIGVSNVPVVLLHELLSHDDVHRIPPAVNQCEGHPYLQQTNLVKYCQYRGVHYQAYSPLGTPGYKEANEPSILEDPVLQEIAKRHGNQTTTAQICLAWALQRGTSVVVKSVTEQRLRENWAAATEITLTEKDMADIAALERNHRFFRPEDWWPEYPMAVFD